MRHGFIGFGNVASAIHEGLQKEQHNSFLYISATNRHAHVPCASSYTELVSKSDVIWFCIKPQQLEDVLHQLAGVDFTGKTLVSTLAGKKIEVFEQALGKEVVIVRTMPNLAIAYQKSITAICANRHTAGTQRVVETLSRLGQVLQLDEAHFDNCTAVFGSGPAFILLVLQSFREIITTLGVSDEQVNTLLAELLSGTAEYLKENHKSYSLQHLIDRVTSKGGTTEAGIKSFHENHGSDIVVQMLVSAAQRSEELSK